ncbi:MAG TPA: methyltransferase domain-containing protein [Bacteroidia bacterium]|jgi:SAM-dependent methyltransferase|nr:methyltransferase domain-containing protein [Bacteroidia bacterium]
MTNSTLRFRNINPALSFRNEGYASFLGEGIEIGAFHQPAPIPASCNVKYCDAVTKEQAAGFFPEVDPTFFVDVDYILDLNTQALSQFPDETFNFVVFNHVIEHIANPIKIVNELFRVLKKNGKVAISVPDKDYTSDKNRNLTPYSHLIEEYYDDVTEVTDEHYIDYLRGCHPHLLNLSAADIAIHVQNVKNRKEHAHVWNSETFEEFLKITFAIHKIKARLIFKSVSKDNKFEYFSVWEKL